MRKRISILYYDDEQNNEFSKAVIEPRKIGDDYVYLHESFWGKTVHFLAYRAVATPLAFLYVKLFFCHRVVNRRVLKDFRNSGFFLFGNHTQDIADALIPSLLAFPKHVYTIAHPNNVSIPFLKHLTPYLGALPLPDTLKATGHFMQAIRVCLDKKRCIAIYPEAHIWPYYTEIRPFSDKSFFYPIKYQAPTFCFTNTYQKRRIGKRPKIVTYVDGPFYPQEHLSVAKQRKDLRDKIYACMMARSRASNFQYIEYRKKEEENG